MTIMLACFKITGFGNFSYLWFVLSLLVDLAAPIVRHIWESIVIVHITEKMGG